MASELRRPAAALVLHLFALDTSCTYLVIRESTHMHSSRATAAAASDMHASEQVAVAALSRECDSVLPSKAIRLSMSWWSGPWTSWWSEASDRQDEGRWCEHRWGSYWRDAWSEASDRHGWRERRGTVTTKPAELKQSRFTPDPDHTSHEASDTAAGRYLITGNNWGCRRRSSANRIDTRQLLCRGSVLQCTLELVSKSEDREFFKAAGWEFFQLHENGPAILYRTSHFKLVTATGGVLMGFTKEACHYVDCHFQSNRTGVQDIRIMSAHFSHRVAKVVQTSTDVLERLVSYMETNEVDFCYGDWNQSSSNGAMINVLRNRASVIYCGDKPTDDVKWPASQECDSGLFGLAQQLRASCGECCGFLCMQHLLQHHSLHKHGMWQDEPREAFTDADASWHCASYM
eukprot:2672695-Amphidinium_carterae.1